MPDEVEVRRESPSAAISTEAVQLLREYTGRGPTKAKTLIHDDLVVLTVADTMLKAEKTLIADGKTDLVMNLRQQFQRTMRDDLCAIVERHVDRKVIAFMSDNHVDPDMAVEVFILEPATDGSSSASAAA